MAGMAHRLDHRPTRHRGAMAPPMAPASVGATLETVTCRAPQHGCRRANLVTFWERDDGPFRRRLNASCCRRVLFQGEMCSRPCLRGAGVRGRPASLQGDRVRHGIRSGSTGGVAILPPRNRENSGCPSPNLSAYGFCRGLDSGLPPCPMRECGQLRRFWVMFTCCRQVFNGNGRTIRGGEPRLRKPPSDDLTSPTFDTVAGSRAIRSSGIEQPYSRIGQLAPEPRISPCFCGVQ